jgi:hypothetical protein
MASRSRKIAKSRPQQAPRIFILDDEFNDTPLGEVESGNVRIVFGDGSAIDLYTSGQADVQRVFVQADGTDHELGMSIGREGMLELSTRKLDR